MIQTLVVPYLGKKQSQKVQTYDLEQFYATLSRTPRGLYKQGVKQTPVSYTHLDVYKRQLPILFHRKKTAGIFAPFAFGKTIHLLLLMMTPATQRCV